jgi:hypothetical protein
MAEGRERPNEAPEGENPDEAVMGAPPGRDPNFQLHREIGEEVERLATSPREEVRRLSSELSEGEAETTPLIAASVVGIGASLIVAIVIGLVVLGIYLA